MQTEDLRLFVTIVEQRSFTAAADRLGLSKQYVSRRAAALEDSLGVRLLNRTTRRLQPTDLGLALYERAQGILAALDETRDLITGNSAELRGTLRVSAPMSFGTLHIAPLIPRFLETHPEVELTLDLSDRAVDLIAEGYDMALRGGLLRDSSLIAQRLLDMRSVVCASPAYLARQGRPSHPQALGQHECLLYGHGGPIEWLFRIDGKPAAIVVKGRLRTNNGEVVREAALADAGIAYLPDFLVARPVADGRLVSILDDYRPPVAGVHAVYPRHRQPSRLVQAFIAYLREALRGS